MSGNIFTAFFCAAPASSKLLLTKFRYFVKIDPLND